MRRVSCRGKFVGVVVAGMVAAAGLAGCTVSGPGPSAGSTPGQAATHAGTVTPGPRNDLELRKHVVVKSCQGSGDGWTASGTVENTAERAHEYAITVHFTDDKATEIGAKDTKVEVGPGATQTWSVTQKVKTGTTVRCVLGAVT